MNLRRLALLSGLIGFGIGILELITPEITTVPTDQRARFVIGTILLFITIFIAESIWDTKYHYVHTLDPEVRQRNRVPGDTLEHVAEYFLDTDRYYRGPRVKEGIRAAAVQAITRVTDASREDAEQAVDTGAWTDNASAKSFLTESVSRQYSITRWLLNIILPETSYRRDIQQTVTEILRIANQPLPAQQPRHRLRDLARSIFTRSENQYPSQPADAEPETRVTNHWAGITVLIVVCFGVGLLTAHPGIFLGGLVGIGYLAYAQALPISTSSPSCTRELSESNPTPGDEIEVTVTVTNNGSTYLPDVRIIDHVPDTLDVTTASPRFGTPLAPRGSVSYTYAITARRGVHAHGPVQVITKNPSNSMEHNQFIDTPTTITCIPPPDPLSIPVPLRNQTTHITGQIGTETGGDGIEFYATRDYRAGDELHRINWHKLARTGELTTLEYRQERTAKVVLAIDTTPSAYISHSPFADHAVYRSVTAALRIYDRLIADGHLVGITTFDPTTCWISPGSGTAHQDQVHEILGTGPVFSSHSSEPTDTARWSVNRLRRQLPADCQVIVFSPVCDTATSSQVQRLNAFGVPVSVISPDPTGMNSPSQHLAKMFRSFQLSDLRTNGIPLIDWAPTESLDHAVLRQTPRGPR